MTIQKGDKIFYHGDMANKQGRGEITNIKKDQFGTYCKVELNDGREFNIPKVLIKKEYKGHAGTKFVKLEAYKKWDKEQFQLLKK